MQEARAQVADLQRQLDDERCGNLATSTTSELMRTVGTDFVRPAVTKDLHSAFLPVKPHVVHGFEQANESKQQQ
jgi:hypothetical protein